MKFGQLHTVSGSELNNAIDWLLDIRTESTTIYITFLNFLVLMDDA